MSDGTMSHYQSFVTPDNQTILDAAAQYSTIEDIYDQANAWLYVSDPLLNGETDVWLSPEDFLTSTPHYETNPVPGTVAGDCEEQANTLVSILRAAGISAEDVRVVLGRLPNDENPAKGHVWAEILLNGGWTALDPSQGPQWNDNLGLITLYKGKDFEYYRNHDYPVTDVIAYYNDLYFLDVENNTGNAPETWSSGLSN
jgi:hypothetical protein